METSTPDDARFRGAVTSVLNAHDLLGVLGLRAPADEYDSEMEDFVRLIAAGAPITPEVVSSVGHKWFGVISEEPEPPSAAMAALAADLQSIRLSAWQPRRIHTRQPLPAEFEYTLLVRSSATSQ
jgi:hypothetical protein